MRLKSFFLIQCISLTIFQSLFAESTAPIHLRCEYKIKPLGIDMLKPRLYWQLSGTKRGKMQSAYQIQVATSLDNLVNSENLVWDSDKVFSDQSIHIEYSGSQLQSRKRYHWRVRIWDSDDELSPWSENSYWEMAMLSADDWLAKWIQPDLKEDLNKSNPAPLLRKEFILDGKVKNARLYVTSLGLYEADINGEDVADQVFTPGWTSYDNRLQYQTYDITNLLQSGTNAIAVTLGDGWYRGNIGWKNSRNVYGTKLAVLAQMHIQYEDGKEELVVTDNTWKSSTGPILFSDIYNGELYDARKEKEGWTVAGYNDISWKAVTVINHRKDILIAPQGPAIRKTEELRPLAILRTPGGDTVVDMGQNMVGWIRLSVKGPAGTSITMRHAEVLDKDGNFYTGNLRGAAQTVGYILKGNGVEVFEPHFTFQGFRYVAIEGLLTEPTLDDLTGIVIHSDMMASGTFSCSNPLLNQLQKNIVWGQRGNFLDVPTDCPQRDERMGWTGDAQVFTATACFNMDAAGFFGKWLKDIAADQQSSGAIPHVVPNVLSHGKPTGSSASAGWADAAVIIPWTIYEIYGDTRVLEQQYASMKKWVEYQRKQAGNSYLWTQDFTFGDWLSFNTTRSDYPGATTDKDLISSAFFGYSTSILQKAAIVLGKKDDIFKYGELLKKIKKAFAKEFITASGRLSSNTQTAYTLALEFDLVPENLRNGAAKRLAEDVNRFKHITTGFLGTPLICHVLCDYGYYDEAFMLLNRKEYPSWLYPVMQGATTIWERWDGIKPDSSFQDEGMNSFNHYAYGAIGDWMYRFITGINPDAEKPGYKHSIIKPHWGGGLTQASASLQTGYGLLKSGWQINNEEIEVTILIPANTTATILLKDAEIHNVLEGQRPLTIGDGIKNLAQTDYGVNLEVGSGEYLFQYSTK